ncbi:MAG: hypothetical protein IH891_11085 [Planctomycetes bacterium]|nr:hypothetical protein [Planctomycetota bacterium]
MTTSDVYRIASGPVPEDLEEHLDTAHSMEHSRAALVTAMLFGAASPLSRQVRGCSSAVWTNATSTEKPY